METIDPKKDLKHLYAPRAGQISLVDVPAMNFWMIDGAGDPNGSPAFAAAVEALFTVSYTIKFALKKGPQAVYFPVMPLEGLWWAEDMQDFTAGDKSGWLWTLMIMQPAPVTAEVAARGLEEAARKKDLPELARLRFECLAEGCCAQAMHVGPFSAEGPLIARIHDFIAERGERAGKHHEIYLSDIRRGDPANWRTVIRQPLKLR